MIRFVAEPTNRIHLHPTAATKETKEKDPEAGSFRSFILGGGPGRNRTFNLRIKSPLLCQLSYEPDVAHHYLIDGGCQETLATLRGWTANGLQPARSVPQGSSNPQPSSSERRVRTTTPVLRSSKTRFSRSEKGVSMLPLHVAKPRKQLGQRRSPSSTTFTGN